mmetsp:Transcript_29934/g.80110  ORF Transcript_29934/g.80110 Transcript_29934/m.80110 type:complete len:228 (-) Transcript_29934:610-1293(-)
MRHGGARLQRHPRAGPRRLQQQGLRGPQRRRPHAGGQAAALGRREGQGACTTRGGAPGVPEAPLHRALHRDLPGAFHALNAYRRRFMSRHEPLRAGPAPGVPAAAHGGRAAAGGAAAAIRRDRPAEATHGEVSGVPHPFLAVAVVLGAAAPALQEVSPPRPEAAERADVSRQHQSAAGRLRHRCAGGEHGGRPQLNRRHASVHEPRDARGQTLRPEDRPVGARVRAL